VSARELNAKTYVTGISVPWSTFPKTGSPNHGTSTCCLARTYTARLVAAVPNPVIVLTQSEEYSSYAEGRFDNIRDIFTDMLKTCPEFARNQFSANFNRPKVGNIDDDPVSSLQLPGK